MIPGRHFNVLIIALACVTLSAAVRYQPTWESLDSRPLPSWYDEGKFGIFLHWGVYSVPGFGSEWFWNYLEAKRPEYVAFMQKNYRPGFTYPDFGPMFTAEFFDPDKWADIFEAAGARYVVLTSKHHEGFANWRTNLSFNWNAVDIGPKRDLVADLATAVRKKPNIHFGLYHSLFEWFNPIWLKDKESGFKTRNFATEKSIPELYELVNTYKPDVIWSDGAPADYTYWGSREFLAWLYNDSPVKDSVVTNDRWGHVVCKHGGFFTCADRFNPGHVLNHKWENAMTVDRGSWGYRRNTELSTYLSIEQLLTQLISTVSCGGNLLLNVGPTHDGRIIPVFEERLRQIGSWLQVNGEAIYGTQPWLHQNDTLTKSIWYTSKKNTDGSKDVYAILLKWPDTPSLKLGAATPSTMTKVTLLGYPDSIPYQPLTVNKGIDIVVPAIPFNKMPCQWAWVFKMTMLKNM